MATIQTPVRSIKVLETLEQVKEKMDLQWMELTEDTTIFIASEYVPMVEKIILNRNYIIEVYD